MLRLFLMHESWKNCKTWVCPPEGWIKRRTVKVSSDTKRATAARLQLRFLIIMLSSSWSESYWEALLKFSSNKICMLHAAPVLHTHTNLTFTHPHVRLLPTQSICDFVAFRSCTVQLDADKALEDEQNVKQSRKEQIDTSIRSIWVFWRLLPVVMSGDQSPGVEGQSLAG